MRASTGLEFRARVPDAPRVPQRRSEDFFPWRMSSKPRVAQGTYGEPPFLARQEILVPASSALLRPERVQAPRRIRLGAPIEPRALPRGDDQEAIMTDEFARDDIEPAESATAQVLHELQLYGYRPGGDEPDPRPLPEAGPLQGAVADMFDALVATLSDTRLEGDLQELLWSLTSVFHFSLQRVDRALDRNECEQRRSQRDQDGSEIRSVELERLLAEGLSLVERRNANELMRDAAVTLFERHLGECWRPRNGSRVSHRALTSAVIDSRDFIAAKRRAEIEPLTPAGAKIAFTGGVDCNDHQRIWAALDRVHAKHADMVLLHGGTPRGAEKIASAWADHRKAAQIVFKPDWIRHGKAAPFKRNDALLEALPIGLVVFPGSGVTNNLADKAKRLGIPLLDHRR